MASIIQGKEAGGRKAEAELERFRVGGGVEKC